MKQEHEEWLSSMLTMGVSFQLMGGRKISDGEVRQEFSHLFNTWKGKLTQHKAFSRDQRSCSFTEFGLYCTF